MTTVTQTRTDAGLSTALRISVSRLARRLRAQRAASGLTEAVLSETQLAALSALEVHQAMTPGELAEHEKVQPPGQPRILPAPHALHQRPAFLGDGEDNLAPIGRVR